MCVGSAVQYWGVIEPSVPSIETVASGDVPSMYASFTISRYGLDANLPSRFKCGERMRWPVHNGEGWDSSWVPGCGVDTFTNIYLGIPKTGTDQHVLRFVTQDAAEPTLRVYVNGKMVDAHLDGDTYTVDLLLSYADFTSPIVLTTIEWTHELTRPKVKLLSIELV
jgi:hypothetical protein